MDEEIVQVSKVGDITVVTLVLDNLTMHDNEELKEAFTGVLDGGAKNIVLDLSGTAFISSIIIASLVFMMKRAKEAGDNLILCGVKGGVKEVLELTNLDKVFDIFENKEKALEHFAKK